MSLEDTPSGPGPDSDLVAQLAYRLNPDDPTKAHEQLASSPLLDGDGHWLRTLMAATNQLRGPEVPPDLHTRLVDLFANDDMNQRWAGPMEETVSILDTRDELELVGLRGPTKSQAWTVVLSAPSGELLIDGISQDGVTTLEGQLLERDPVVVPASYRVRIGGKPQAIEVDSLGRFSMGEFQPGTYSFELEGSRFALRWKLDVGK